jgi:hypothetical protein
MARPAHGRMESPGSGADRDSFPDPAVRLESSRLTRTRIGPGRAGRLGSHAAPPDSDWPGRTRMRPPALSELAGIIISDRAGPGSTVAQGISSTKLRGEARRDSESPGGH